MVHLSDEQERALEDLRQAFWLRGGGRLSRCKLPEIADESDLDP